MASRKFIVTLRFNGDSDGSDPTLSKLKAEMTIYNISNKKVSMTIPADTDTLLNQLKVMLNRWTTGETLTLTANQFNALKSFIQTVESR